MLTDFNSIILKFCEIGGENCDSRQHPMQKFLNKAKYFYARTTTIVCLYGSHCIWWQCPHKIELYVYRIICICGRSAFVCLIPYRFDMLFLQPPALSTFTYLTRWDPSKTKKISSDKCGIRICLRLQFSELTFLFSLF